MGTWWICLFFAVLCWTTRLILFAIIGSRRFSPSTHLIYPRSRMFLWIHSYAFYLLLLTVSQISWIDPSSYRTPDRQEILFPSKHAIPHSLLSLEALLSEITVSRMQFVRKRERVGVFYYVERQRLSWFGVWYTQRRKETQVWCNADSYECYNCNYCWEKRARADCEIKLERKKLV